MIFCDSVVGDGVSNPSIRGFLGRQRQVHITQYVIRHLPFILRRETGMPRDRSSSRTSWASSTSSSSEEEVEGGYEADSDLDMHLARAQRENRDVPRRSRVHYLVERAEPIMEVLKPVTAEELAHLQATTDIPIPPALLSSILSKEAATGPSSGVSSASESSSDGAEGLGGESQPIVDVPTPLSPTDPSSAKADLELAPFSPSDHFEEIDLNDGPQPSPAAAAPPTPDLLPWQALVAVEPSPIALASPVVLRPLVIHAPRPRLARMPAFPVAVELAVMAASVGA